MPTPIPPVLQVQSIQKQYRSVKAVDGLSFSVEAGEIFALLGPNGAGKTTTVRMINGIIQPDAGSVAFGAEGMSGSFRPGLGYLPEDRGLYRDQPIERTLVFFGRLRGLSKPDARREAGAWLERFGLADRAKEKLEALSKGNQQKVQFAAAILHKPRFAILDEPFSGLDPVNQDAFLALLTEMRDGGMTILLSAHQMQLVERIADRILIMNQGRALLHGTLDELRARSHEGHRLVLRTRDATALTDRAEFARIDHREDGSHLAVGTDGASLSDLLRTAATCCVLDDIQVEQPTLHDIYVRAVSAPDSHEHSDEHSGEEAAT